MNSQTPISSHHTTQRFKQVPKPTRDCMPMQKPEASLNDPPFDNFLFRVGAYSHFRQEVLYQASLAKLIRSHSRYKYLLMAHNQDQCRALGRLIGSPTDQPLKSLINSYFKGFIEAISKPASRKNHTNALLHILDYLKGKLPLTARDHIIKIIHNYNKGLIPLATPLSLLKHGSAYIKDQRYLDPYPKKLALYFNHSPMLTSKASKL